jgi:sulfate permease, SulP family
LLLLARLLRLGFLADFLSRTVLVGFLTGVGFQVGIAVLGEMLGLEVHAHRTVGQLAEIFRGLPRMHLPSLASPQWWLAASLRSTGSRQECPVR